jgi:hypothetical protein
MTRMEQRLLDPAADGAIEAAREFGTDLSLLVERLRRTPAMIQREPVSSMRTRRVS